MNTKNCTLRPFGLFIILLLTACHGSPAPTPLVSGPNPLANTDLSNAPNILLIVADDMGYSDIGSFGGEIPTPHIDALAKKGIVFSNFHVASSCAPTRSMLLTGVDNHLAGQGTMSFLTAEQRGKPGYEDRLNERVVTVTRLLEDAGYNTYMAGKWHLGTRLGQYPADRGFSRSYSLLSGGASHFATGPLLLRPTYILDRERVSVPENFYSTDFYTDTLIEFIDEQEYGDQPFFAYASYTAPHWPLQALDEDINHHLETYQAGWDLLRKRRFEKMKAQGIIAEDLPYPPRWEDVPAWSSLSTERKKIEAKKMAIYAAMISNMDGNIGRLLQHLRDRNVYDNTIVLFMSDNGAEALDPETISNLMIKALTLGTDNNYDNMGRANSFVTYGKPWANLGSAHLKGHKVLGTEGGIRSPLIVSMPSRFSEERISHAFTSVMDITPTLLDLAGISHPGTSYRGRQVAPLDGSSLLPLLSGKGSHVVRPRQFLGFELFGHRALFKGDWKLLKQQAPYGTKTWELYNLAEDPAESRDLAGQFPGRVKKMTEDFNTFVKEKNVILPPPDFDALGGKFRMSDVRAWIDQVL